ncbi:hypothetical protein ACFPOG_00005, partial [Paenibacillus aestuarii]
RPLGRQLAAVRKCPIAATPHGLKRAVVRIFRTTARFSPSSQRNCRCNWVKSDCSACQRFEPLCNWAKPDYALRWVPKCTRGCVWQAAHSAATEAVCIILPYLQDKQGGCSPFSCSLFI